MSFKSFLIFLLAFSMLLVSSIVVLAEETVPTTDPVTDPTTDPTTVPTTPTPAIPTAKDQQMATAITETCKIPATAQEVADMHAAGYGYGEISKAYGMASLSGKAVTEITAMRAQDIGWGEIAKTLGFKVSDVTGKQKAINNSAKAKANENKSKNNSDEGSNGKGKGGNGGGKGGGKGK